MILINGRAATRPRVMGVERWAVEMATRLPALAPERYTVVLPPPRLPARAGQAWEQIALPARAARSGGGVIFSPAQSAPLAWPRNVLVLHDMAVKRVPENYSHAYRRWHEPMESLAARRALVLIAVSQFSKDEIVELLGIEPDRIVVISGGVDERFGATAADPQITNSLGLTRPYVLTVGTSSRRKNFPLLATLARTLASKGIDLAWAGGGLWYVPAADTSRGLRRLGFVSDRDLAALYAGARAFVLLSGYEGFGLPCLEAMASGVPVLAADRGALPETCAGAALLVDPDDEQQTLAALQRLLSDEQLRAELTTRGLARAAQLSWDRAARATDAVLAPLAA